MTTAANVLNSPHEEKAQKVFRWKVAEAYPVLTFLLITFAWTWLFWLAVIPLRGKNDLLLMMIVLIGSYGPAIGGILTLGLKNGMSLALAHRQLLMLLTAADEQFPIPVGATVITPTGARRGMQAETQVIFLAAKSV